MSWQATQKYSNNAMLSLLSFYVFNKNMHIHLEIDRQIDRDREAQLDRRYDIIKRKHTNKIIR